jgi:predicted PurR-regulated permease PerM
VRKAGRPHAHRDDDASSPTADPADPAGAPAVPVTPAPAADARPAVESVPWGVRVAAAWSWRIVAVIAAAALIGYALIRLHIVVVPVLIALLLAAALQPIVVWVERHRVPHTLAAALVLVGGIVIVVGGLAIVIKAFVNGLPDLSSRISHATDDLQHWLVHGPLKLSDRQVSDYVDNAKDFASKNRDTLTSGAVATAVTLGHVLTGALITLFTLFFFLRDGRKIWTWTVRLLPRGAREPMDGAGVRAFATLVSFVRATLLVALVDGAGIGIWCAILGVPLALPLGTLVFVGAFVPLIGATVSGAVAVVVALVAKGFFTALLVLLGVLAIQQLEGHVLQPFLLGRAVQVHPLAVVLAIASGVLLAGITGALIAVPTVACANAAVKYLVHRGDAEKYTGAAINGP